MIFGKWIKPAEAVQHLIQLDASGFLMLDFLVRGIGPGAEIVHEAVCLGVPMDVSDQVSKVGVGRYRDAFEGFFKKASGTVVLQVDGFCVGVEKMSKLEAGILIDLSFRNADVALDFIQGLDADEKVKVVAQETVGKRGSNGRNVPGIEAEEVFVVAGFDEDGLAVVAAIVNMVVVAVVERSWAWHLSLLPDWLWV